MDIFSFISLFGGLALFLYGMHVMSCGLEKLAGGKMEQILRKMTSNRLKGLALGAGVTSVIQSSSAVTVMLVGLVNSGIMQLSQAISVTMGSNIGTTVTAWILSLAGISSDSVWLKLLEPKNFSPVIALVGVILLMASKKQKRKDIGTIFIGFAVLMYGMTLMSGSVAPLSEVPQFRNVLTAFSNPVLGVLAGLAFTAIIQSSSASVGVLQALSLTGTVTYRTAIPIIMGQNIGTCVSAMLASIGTNKNAKRVAAVHVMFNCIGTVVCLTAWCVADAIVDISFASKAVSPFAIAVIHSIFNIVTTFLLIPFAGKLEMLSKKIVRDSDHKENYSLLDERLLTMPSFAVAKAMGLAVKMSETARRSIIRSIGMIDKYDFKTADEIRSMEDQIDKLEDSLGTYLVKLSKCELSDKEAVSTSMMLHTIGDFERIGDHSVNLLNVATEMHEKNISFSHEAKRELTSLTSALIEILSITANAFETKDLDIAISVEPLEQVIDDLISQIKNRHINRLQNGNCTIELGFILSDLLTNYERISDHCSNIAVAVIETAHGTFDTHEYLNTVKSQPSSQFTEQYESWLNQYAID